MGYSPSVVVPASDRALCVISRASRHRSVQFCRVALAIGALLIAGTTASRAGSFPAFGPQDYTRGTGAPVTVANNFSVLNPNTQYTLKAFNGGLQDSQTELVSSGLVTVNGVQVIGPSNFNQNVTEVDVPVTLQASNTISVQVRGQPGGVLTIQIVGVDNDPPTIKATASPAPNAAGWNNTNVTVTFVCSDATSPVVSCPGPQTVATEGATQLISGTATDAAGNSATTSVTLNIDKTPPTISITSPANGATFTSSSAAVTGTVSDALSGVSAVTCDGASATAQSGAFSCSVTLNPGSNTITAQATDVAGNISSATESVTFSSALPPVINSFSPTSAAAGIQVTLTGSNFTANGTATPQVTLSQQGTGSIAAPIVSFTATSISFIIPAGAASGQITVTVGNQSVVSAASLSVVASSSFSLSSSPSTANVQQGTSVSISLGLSSSNGFSQLADLSVTGVPTGVTASFSPVRITAGQFSILTITAPAGQPVGSATLTISAAATVQSIPTTQSASTSLNVQAATTSLIGRIVESDNIETPIPGIIATFLGVDDAGHTTGCSGQTRSDAAGNFAFTNLGTSCLGRQLVGYDGNSSTDGEKYAGVNLAYTMIAGQITGPELVHLPAITDAETIMVKQNATVDQVFSYSTIPGITVTVYAGTTLTLPDATKPDPFPMAAVLVPVDRLPDAPAPTTGLLRASIVAFQPADTTSNQPVSVTFPNVVNTPPGVNMELDTLDPIVGELVKYGTGTVSADASEIVPDPDPAHPGHRFGISHFDWHGPMAPAPNGNNPSPDPHGPKKGDPVDAATGLLAFTKTDLSFGGARGRVSIQRTYRTLSGNPGPFGVGTNHNYGYSLDILNLVRGTGTFVNLVMPDGNQFPFVQQGTNTFVNSNNPSLLGSVITSPSNGTFNLRWKNGTVFQFSSPSAFATVAFLNSVTDANGNTTILVRGNSSQPIQITQIIDPVGRALNLAYDNFSRILSIVDPIGRKVQYSYNSQGTLATVTDPAGAITTYGYDSGNRMTSIADPRQIIYLQNTYDANGRVIQQVAADGGVTTFAYTLLNPTLSTSPVLLTTVTDPRGNTTTYHFNPQGFLLDSTDALGEKTIYSRDPGTNLVLSITDPLNRTATFAYDAAGNITSTTRLAGTPSTVTTSFTYNPTFNRLASATDPLGHTTSVKYDDAGNVIGVKDPLGQQTLFAYDANGELIAATDSLANTTRFAYANGDVARITDPLSRVTTRGTDAIGRLISLTNHLGQTTHFQYSPLNQLTNILDPFGQPTSFTYDGNGNVLTVTDINQHTTAFSYDKVDRMASRTDPLSHTENYQYDLAGNLSQFTDRRGVVSKYTYDALNRRTLANFGSESSISYAYDAGNRLIQVVDSAAGTIAGTYDGLDRLSSEVTPEGSVNYAYDAAGRRTRMSVSGQDPVSYSYNDADRLAQITQGANNVSFSFDADNRAVTLTLPNGVLVSYNYNAASQLTGLSYTRGTSTLGNLTYTYDLSGRRFTSVGGSLARTGLPAALASSSYNAANQATQFDVSSLTYDANGNITGDGQNTYAWNARNQLVSISGAISASFRYDALGRRIGKVIGNTSTSYVYDGMNPVEELSGTAVVRSVLAGGVDQYFIRTDSAGTTSFLTDALGSIVALTGSDGSTLAQYTYEPFGNTTSSGAASTNPFQYTGRENDGTDLYFYRARYYSPRLQRFISEDPIGFAGGDANLYAYVLNDPVSFRDPNGKLLIGAVVGAVVGGVEGAVGAYLQGGSTSDIIASGLIGGALGGVVGLLDPTEGALTIGELALIGGGAGLAGDIAGQVYTNWGKPCKAFNVGEAIGAGLGGAAAGAMSAVTAIGFASVGAGELGQSLAGAGISAAPATLGGPIGNALGPEVHTGAGRKDAPCH